jgi:hypothetical protein
MKSIKISNTLSGVEDDGTIKILTTLTKESFEWLRMRPFPEADINEAIIFFTKKKDIEEKFNLMQEELYSLNRGGQLFASYQPTITKEDKIIGAGITEADITEVEVTNIVDVDKVTHNKNDASNEDENKNLLYGILDALEDEEGFN